MVNEFILVGTQYKNRVKQLSRGIYGSCLTLKELSSGKQVIKNLFEMYP